LDIEIIEDKENALLDRREVKFSVRFVGPTPERKVIKEALRAQLGVDPKLVVVGKLEQPYGSQTAKGEARIYKDEAGKAVEHEYFLNREVEEEKKVPAEKGKKEAEAEKEEKAEKKEDKARGKKEEKKAEGEEEKKEKQAEKAEKPKGEKKEDKQAEQPKPEAEKKEAKAEPKKEEPKGEKKEEKPKEEKPADEEKKGGAGTAGSGKENK